VATWALLGAVWDVLEAFTEGIGEAAAIQVAFLLAAFQPERARKLANTVIYLAVIQSLLVTSALYMSGKYLAVLFSSDPTIQHITNNSFALIGLANVTMAFAQVSWSLIGAQGRFRLATSVVFFSRWLVTVPIALIAIFAFFLDLNSVAGSLVVGYATASCALTFIVLRSDWERLARLMQEMNNPIPPDDGNSFDDFEDDSSDDEDGFGFDESSEEESAPSKARQPQEKSKREKRLRHRSHEAD
jgi:Na+-driven multidrug efflux pump